MTATLARHRCDVFCRVVDNFGDAAVCWRLSRSLAADHGFEVRLWIDRPEVLAALQPAVDARLDRQYVEGVEVCRLPSTLPAADLPDIAIDAFGNGLPEAYAIALARRRPHASWIVLEYLSAEDWAAGVHRLPSPHPSLDIRRHFFCPGFGADSGGLLREPGLLAARRSFDADCNARARFWDGRGFDAPPEGSTVVSLFGYANPGLPALLDSMAAGPRPVLLALAPGPLADAAAAWFAAAGSPRHAAGAHGSPHHAAAAIHAASTGALAARWLPFLAQPDYDRLLWASDFNFVRGEDSLVRALWAARPLCWHLYPQPEDAQCPKLEAFIGASGRLAVDDGEAGRDTAAPPGRRGDLARPDAPDPAWADLQRAWNGCGVPPEARGPAIAAAWKQVHAALPLLLQGAQRRAARLAEGPDLAARLASFCREQLK